MPTSNGISAIPPDICVLLKDSLGNPAIGSKPIDAISNPMDALTNPLATEPPPIEAMIVSARIAIAKYSGVPNDSA